MNFYRDVGCSQEDHLENCGHFGYSGGYLSPHAPDCPTGKYKLCTCNPTARRKAAQMATRKKTAKRKPQTPKEEKRIYVFLPEKVTVMQGKEAVQMHMVAGRLMAQGEHVTGKMRGHEYNWHHAGDSILLDPITTINLSVRNSRELDFIQRLLECHEEGQSAQLEPERFRVYEFLDKNPDFYGTSGYVKTAVCTSPIERSVIEDVIGHLELYDA